MRTLLIVDDQEIFRRPISEALRMKGFRVLEASDSVSAMAHAQLEKPDLALIDIRMPEVNGLDLIRMMQARASTARIPVILVTAQAHREDIATGSALGIRDFLLKSSFSVGELVERIETRIATASAIPPAPPPPPASLQLPGRSDRLAPRSSSTSTYASDAPISSEDASTSGGPSTRQKLLPPAEVRALPAPIAEILAIASSQTASLSQVQAIVRRDPILAERVMTAASGVGIKGTAEIESLEGALRVMGIENLVRLVASTPVLSMEELNGRNGQELVQIWSHGLATAVIAERIAPSHERLPSFLQGLFHVIPALIGVQSVGAAWPEVAARARREGFNGIDALALTFGQPTGVFAEDILARMRLPEPIAGVVREWHRDKFRRGSKSASEACRRVDAAASIASGIGFAWDDLSSVRPITTEESRTWTDPEAIPDDIPRLRGEIQRMQVAAGLPSPPDGSLIAGLWGPTETLYWRDARFRAPDPVELALSNNQVKRLDNPERLLEGNRPLAIVCLEPGSPWWSAVSSCPEPTLVIHCAPAPARAVRDKVRLLQAPIPLYILHEAIGDS